MAHPTTWMERFRDALTVLCGGKEPSLELCEKWLSNEQDSNGSDPLQDWVCCNTVLPWSQGIIVIDAAYALAESPEEGSGHLPQE